MPPSTSPSPSLSVFTGSRVFISLQRQMMTLLMRCCFRPLPRFLPPLASQWLAALTLTPEMNTFSGVRVSVCACLSARLFVCSTVCLLVCLSSRLSVFLSACSLVSVCHVAYCLMHCFPLRTLWHTFGRFVYPALHSRDFPRGASTCCPAAPLARCTRI